MSDTSASDTRTELALILEGELGAGARPMAWQMAVRLVTGADPAWRFTGKIAGAWTIAQIVTAMRPDLPVGGALHDPDLMPNLAVNGLEVAYDSASGLVMASTTLDLKLSADMPLKVGLVVACLPAPPPISKPPQPTRLLAGVFTKTPISLASIGAQSGIIAQFLGEARIDNLGIYWAADDIITTEPVFGSPGGGPRRFGKGLSFSARFGGETSGASLDFPAEGPPPLPAEISDGSTPKVESEKTDGRLRYWRDIDKTYGPLHLRRIGGEWHQGKIGVLLDAGVDLLGLKVGLSGLAVRVPPSKLTTLAFQDLDFALDGLTLDLKRGPVSIGGALLKSLQGEEISYSGAAVIRTSAMSLSAIGSYALVAGKPSFFIFGAYLGTIGGPPAFLVQGLAAGFGYNRVLVLPPVDKVHEFPLVSMVMGDSGTAAGGTGALISKLDAFPPAPGQYWLAAGVKFTSFKLIDGFALVTVAFGARFEIALLGLAILRQPLGLDAPFIQIEMALKARFSPDEGVLSIMAVLTENSFLFSRNCKLTGGFAFNVWFNPTNPLLAKDNHAGDFVVTFGGYHPKFAVPAHYPRVPRIGLSWLMPKQGVAIEGRVYFALTPSFIMAGGRLSAVYRSGSVHAWFDMSLDLLIGWEPFQYEARLQVRLGARVVVSVLGISQTLSFEMGVQFRVWGPPFAGEAKADLGAMSITIPIGANGAPTKVPPLTWQQFAEKFFPRPTPSAPPRPLDIVLAGGMRHEHREGSKTALAVVDPNELRIALSCFVPPTQVRTPAGELATGPAFGIRPMDVRAYRSELVVTVTRAGKAVAMTYRVSRSAVPEALWSPLPAPGAEAERLEARVLPDAISTVEILPRPCNDKGTKVATAETRSAVIRVARLPRAYTFRAPDVALAPERAFREALKAPPPEVVAAFRSAGFLAATDTVAPDLGRLGNMAAGGLLGVPLLVRMGEAFPERAAA